MYVNLDFEIELNIYCQWWWWWWWVCINVLDFKSCLSLTILLSGRVRAEVHQDPECRSDPGPGPGPG